MPIVLDQPKHPVSLAIRAFADAYVLTAPSADQTIPTELRTDRRGRLRRKTRT